MNRKQLDAMLPEGVNSFDEWEQKIPKYRTPLMKRLDSLNLAEHPGNWTREALYEIVLWELNRFPEIGDALFAELGQAAAIPPGEHRKGKELLQKLAFAGRLLQSHFSPNYTFSDPVDIEWLIDDEGIVILQLRPYSK